MPPGVVSASRWWPDRQGIGPRQRATDAVCGIGRKA